MSMSVSALGGFQQIANTQAYSGQQVNNQQTSVGSTSPSGKTGNNFVQAITSALSQLGVSPTSSGKDSDDDTGSGSTTKAGSTTSTSGTTGTSSTSSSQTPDQALQAFVQTLLAAIQSQVSGSGASSSGSGHHHHGGGIGKVESGIQSLIDQLSAASSTGGSTGSSPTSGTTAASTGSDSTTTGNSALSALQSSFNNLLSVDGLSGSSSTLSGFLKNLESNLQGSGTSGNVVHTKA